MLARREPPSAAAQLYPPRRSSPRRWSSTHPPEWGPRTHRRRHPEQAAVRQRHASPEWGGSAVETVARWRELCLDLEAQRDRAEAERDEAEAELLLLKMELRAKQHSRSGPVHSEQLVHLTQLDASARIEAVAEQHAGPDIGNGALRRRAEEAEARCLELEERTQRHDRRESSVGFCSSCDDKDELLTAAQERIAELENALCMAEKEATARADGSGSSVATTADDAAAELAAMAEALTAMEARALAAEARATKEEAKTAKQQEAKRKAMATRKAKMEQAHAKHRAQAQQDAANEIAELKGHRKRSGGIRTIRVDGLHGQLQDGDQLRARFEAYGVVDCVTFHSPRGGFRFREDEERWAIISFKTDKEAEVAQKTVFPPIFNTKNDRFTKTGSGQRGNLKIGLFSRRRLCELRRPKGLLARRG
jgi:hypothetical protein